MNAELQRFMELVNSDEELKKKLEEAVKNYTGDTSEKAVFENILAPIAEEAGVSISADDFTQSVKELNQDEMAQVAGGFGLGFGAAAFECDVIGIGAGTAGGAGAFASCVLIGFGTGGAICMVEGISGSIEEVEPNRKK